jgi:microcystin-dependent protein
MGSSAFEPIGLADTRTVKNKITHGGITGDVLSVGDVIRYDPSTDVYVLAKADSTPNSNFVGVIESIDATDFTLVYSGEISLPDSVMSLISGYTGSQVFYLSDTNAGKLTTTAPSNPGSVIKPVIITTGTVIDSGGSVDGVVVNSIGSSISGDSTVDLSDIQPVGSILAFAGLTSDIPNGWDICDGGFLGVTAYADLYSALNDGNIYGFIQNATLNRTSGSGYFTNDNIVNSKFIVSRPGVDGSIECTLLSGTVNGDGTQITNVNMFVNPQYIDGASEGSYHNSQINNGDSGRGYVDGIPLNAIYSVASPTKTQFKKPDLRARFIVGDSKGITGLESSAFNSYTIGNFGGEESHVLTVGEMPVHTHGSSYTSLLSGVVGVTFDLRTDTSGSHRHRLVADAEFAVQDAASLGPLLATARLHRKTISGSNYAYALSGQNTNDAVLAESSAAGSHSHIVNGTISVSANSLTQEITGTIQNSGGNLGHNNVPQHMVAIWIIKTRKDSYAKILRLGPSGGGAVIAKNTAKRWARASSGAGCTVDISYGTWGVSRVGTGDYQFTHDLISELGTADSSKYIVEAAVVKNGSGATQMFVANPYSLGGVTFGVRVYDVMGATFSDYFQYLNLTLYGGGTAV